MILEELVGSFVSLFSSLIVHTPPISSETLQRDYSLIFEANPEEDEVYDGLIHREYEQETPAELPYYEEDISVLVQQAAGQTRRNFCESFFRSCKTNVGLLMAAVFMLGLLTVGLVYVDLNTTNACREWMHNNFSVPSNVRTVRILGMSVTLLPLYALFPTCVIMLWGFRELKMNHLLSLFLSQSVIISINIAYKVVVFDKITTANVEYRLPGNVIYMLSILCGAYIVARKFKQVSPTVSYSVFRISFILSFAFLGTCLLAFVYAYVIIKYFTGTEDRIKKAIIAALTPGIVIPVTAIAKYLVLRKCSEIITPDRAFALCYFPRGGSIALYRTMQSGFKNIWLFIGLSLFHGVSNVLSKATLNIRIKIWKLITKCINRTCYGPRLEVRHLNTPRIRRLNADVEIQNILFEYTTVILSQAYLACYLVLSFDVSPWQVIEGSLIRIAISLAIDFVFNIISVFIQIHFYDIPMQKVWLNYWRRHLTANAFIIICTVSYFGASLVSVFASQKYISLFNESKLRNCTSVFS